MTRFLESITLKNFLSFGPEGTTLELEDVNVIIGANGSGKSNLIEAINVLRHAPRDIAQPLREGGGVREFLWRPRAGGEGAASATIEVVVGPHFAGEERAWYGIELGAQGGVLSIIEEWLRRADLHAYFRAASGKLHEGVSASVSIEQIEARSRTRTLAGIDRSSSIDSGLSALAQRKDPVGFSEATLFGESLDRSRVYRHWVGGPACPLRLSRRPDAPTISLLENLENFPSRMATLKAIPSIKRRLLELVKDVSPGFDDIEIAPEGGALQLYLIEGDRRISSYRLSDGTLRYLMLLTVLLDPTPPPLLVIEEPELSLHPDVLPSLRDLIIEASERTQIILTTQSPTFLDAWTDYPSYVVVCEREDDSTTLERLEPDDINEREGLGLRWNRGEIGGNRW